MILNLEEFVEREQNFIENILIIQIQQNSKKLKTDSKELYYIKSYCILTNDKIALKILIEFILNQIYIRLLLAISQIEKNNPIFN